VRSRACTARRTGASRASISDSDGQTAEEGKHSHSRGRIAPRNAGSLSLLLLRAGKAGCPPHPWPPCVKKHGEGTAGEGGIIRPSLRQWFTAYFALWGPGLFAPPPVSLITPRTWPQLGRSGPHDFAVRADADRLLHQPVHRILDATSLTTRPLLFNRARDGTQNASDLGAGSNLILKNRIRQLRQIGATGNLHMATCAI
jgi:hypothetical protein